MKRYIWSYTSHMLIPHNDGNYYLVSDVEAQMIPRPDPEEAREAVASISKAKDDILYAECVNGVDSVEAAISRNLLIEAEKALLRLMGVEGEVK